MNLFFVTSRGLTATTWYSNALNISQHVFCSHGRDRPSRGIETDLLLQDDNYRVDRLNYEQWQRKATIDDYVKDLVDASNKEEFIGNVHGYVLIEVMDKLTKSKNNNITVANMVRHPIGFIESYTALVSHRRNDYKEKFYAEHSKRVEENRVLIDKFGLSSNDLNMTSFIEACQSLKKSANEIKLHQVYTIQMEKIVRDSDYFLESFRFLTKGMIEYDLNKLNDIVKVNSHREKHNTNNKNNHLKSNCDIWNEWGSKKRNIFLEILSQEGIKIYEDYGYNISHII